MRTIFAVFALAAALSACATPDHTGVAPDVGLTRTTVATAKYACADGTAFTAVFLMGDMGADLHFPNGDVAKLKQEVSGSGFIYANAHHRLQGKGDEALYAFGRRAETKCVAAK